MAAQQLYRLHILPQKMTLLSATICLLFIALFWTIQAHGESNEAEIAHRLAVRQVRQKISRTNGGGYKFIVADTCCPGCGYNNKENCCCYGTPTITKFARRTIWRTKVARIPRTRTITCAAPAKLRPQNLPRSVEGPEVSIGELTPEPETWSETEIEEPAQDKLGRTFAPGPSSSSSSSGRHLCPVCPSNSSLISPSNSDYSLHGCCPAKFITKRRTIFKTKTKAVRVWKTRHVCSTSTRTTKFWPPPPAPPPPESSTVTKTRTPQRLPFKTPTLTKTKTETPTKAKVTTSTTTFCASSTDYGFFSRNPVSGSTGPYWLLITGPLTTPPFVGAMVANASAFSLDPVLKKRDGLYERKSSECVGGPGSGSTCGTIVGQVAAEIVPGQRIAVEVIPYEAKFVTRAQLYFSCTKPTGNEPLSSYQVIVPYGQCFAPELIWLNATTNVPDCGDKGMYMIIGVSNDCTNDGCGTTTRAQPTTRGLAFTTSVKATTTATATKSSTSRSRTSSTMTVSNTRSSSTGTRSLTATEIKSSLTVTEQTNTETMETATSETISETPSSATASDTVTVSETLTTSVSETDSVPTPTTTERTTFNLKIQTRTETTTNTLVTETCQTDTAFGWIPDQPYSPADGSDSKKWAIIPGPLFPNNTFTGYLIAGAAAFKSNGTEGCTPGAGGKCGHAVGEFTAILTTSGISVTYNMYPTLGVITSAHLFYSCSKPTGSEPPGSFNVTEDNFGQCGTENVTLDSAASGADFASCSNGYYIMVHSSVTCNLCDSTTTTKTPFKLTINTPTPTTEVLTSSETTVSNTETATLTSDTSSLTTTETATLTSDTASLTATKTSPSPTTTDVLVTPTCSSETAFGWIPSQPFSPASSSNWAIIPGPLSNPSQFSGYLVAGAAAFKNDATGGCTPGTGGKCGTIVGEFNVVLNSTGITVNYDMYSGLGFITKAHVWYSCSKPTGSEPRGSYNLTEDGFPSCGTDNVTLDSSSSGAGFDSCSGGYYIMVHASVECELCSVTTTTKTPFKLTINTPTTTAEPTTTETTASGTGTATATVRTTSGTITQTQAQTQTETITRATATCSGETAFGWIPGQDFSPSTGNKWAIIPGPLFPEHTFTGYLEAGAAAFKKNETGGCTTPGTGGQCGTQVGQVTLLLLNNYIGVTFEIDKSWGVITSAHLLFSCNKPSGTEAPGSEFNITQDFGSCGTSEAFTLETTTAGITVPSCPNGYYFMIHASVGCNPYCGTTTRAVSTPFKLTINTPTTTPEIETSTTATATATGTATPTTPSQTATLTSTSLSQTKTQTATTTTLTTSTQTSSTATRKTSSLSATPTPTTSTLTTSSRTLSRTRSQTPSQTTTPTSTTTSRTRSISKTTTQPALPTCSSSASAYSYLQQNPYNAMKGSPWAIGVGPIKTGTWKGTIVAGASAYTTYPNLPSSCTTPGTGGGCGTSVGNVTVVVDTSKTSISVAFTATQGVITSVNVDYSCSVLTARGSPGHYALVQSYPACGVLQAQVSTTSADNCGSAGYYLLIHSDSITNTNGCCISGCSTCT